jgi:hypothetical protein
MSQDKTTLPACQKCQWSARRRPDWRQVERLLCRRYPPHPNHGWPEVAADSLCGEFLARSAEARVAREAVK